MANTNTPRRLASLATAASRGSISTDTVRRMIARGELTGYRLGPRTLRIDLDEFEALIQPIPTVAATRP